MISFSTYDREVLSPILTSETPVPIYSLFFLSFFRLMCIFYIPRKVHDRKSFTLSGAIPLIV